MLATLGFKKLENCKKFGKFGQMNWAQYFESVHQKYTVFIRFICFFISCKYVL